MKTFAVETYITLISIYFLCYMLLNNSPCPLDAGAMSLYQITLMHCMVVSCLLLQPPKDWVLLLVICGLLAIDIVFLIIVTAVPTAVFRAEKQESVS